MTRPRLSAPAGFSGRGLPAAGAAAGAGAVGGAAARSGAGDARAAAPATRPASYPFRGEHQAGIVTPAQDRLHFAAFDVTTDVPRRSSSSCCRRWTDAAERMTRGAAAGPVGAGRRRPRTCRPTTPARRSACRRAG